MSWRLALAAASALLAMPAQAQDGVTPLFASDAPLRLTIAGGIERIAKARPDDRSSQPGTLSVSGGESHAVLLEPRGITRRRKDVCQFPPLRLTFQQPPAATSLFAGQRRLKLVGHCRADADFQTHVLLEYAAYRLFNLITPKSFRARLAMIEYRDSDGKPMTSRYGFFIEDVDDVAARNGMREAQVGTRFNAARLAPVDSARFALFQYMIANLDWAMQAGPEGDSCCHNSRPIGAGTSSAAQLSPVPYDFDFSGLVNAPYAAPPESVKISNVRQRYYRGLCRHNAAGLAQLPQFRALEGQVPALMAAIPGLDDGRRRRAIAFLSAFFKDIATDSTAQEKLFRTCVD